MQKKFFINLVLIVVLNLLIKPFYILGIDAEIQNKVGSADYGIYFSLLNFSFLLNILLDVGINNFNTREISQAPNLIQKHFGQLFFIRLFLFLVYFFFTIGSGLVIGYSNFQLKLLVVLVFNQFLVAFIQFFRSNFTGLHLFKTDAIISILDRSILIIICSVLLWSKLFNLNFQIEHFVYAQTFAYGLTLLISFILLYKNIKGVKLKFDKKYSYTLLKNSMPYALLILFMMLYTRIDSVMLERFLPKGEVFSGSYAKGYRFLEALSMFSLLFAGLLLPLFSKLIKEKKNINELLEFSFSILIPIAFIISINAFFFKENIMNWRYVELEIDTIKTFGVLILTFIPISLSYIFGTLLTANGSMKILNYSSFFGLVINIILNLVLIQDYKEYGTSIATIITQSITVLAQIIITFKIFKVSVKMKAILRFGLLFTLIFLLGFLSKKISTEYQYWALFFSLSIVLSFILLFILKIISFKQLYGFVKKTESI